MTADPRSRTGEHTGHGGLVRRTVRLVRDALIARRYRQVAIAATVVYLLIFLVAIRDITISPGGMRRFIEKPVGAGGAELDLADVRAARAVLFRVRRCDPPGGPC